MSEIAVRDNAESGRYEATVDGEDAGFAEYERVGGVIAFTHTVVDPRHRKQGVASEIARVSLDDARERGLAVRPVCSFYVDYLDRHPEYADLSD